MVLNKKIPSKSDFIRLLLFFILISLILFAVAVWCTIRGINSIGNDAPIWATVLWFIYPFLWTVGTIGNAVNRKS